MAKERIERDEEDLVRLYLTDIGQYPLLTKDDEVRLAQQIEKGNAAREQLADGQGPDAGQEARAAPGRPPRRGRPADVRPVEPATRRVDRQEVPGVGASAARPDPRGQPRPDARRREVRLAQGLQVLDVRHVVDPPGDHPRHREHGPHDPPARTRRRHARPAAEGPFAPRAQARPARDALASSRPRSRCPRTRSPRRCASRPSPSRCRSRCAKTATPSSATSSRTARSSRRSRSRPPRCCRRRSRSCSHRSTSGSARSWRLRFGLDRGEPRTLEEVGEYFNLTRERIRQIEARAMSKLRHPSADTGARDLLAV